MNRSTRAGRDRHQPYRRRRRVLLSQSVFRPAFRSAVKRHPQEVADRERSAWSCMAVSVFGSVTLEVNMNPRLVLAIASWFAAPLVVEFPAGQAVQAQVIGGNRYGIVTIHNKTPWTIQYSYRIGNGPWHQTNV